MFKFLFRKGKFLKNYKNIFYMRLKICANSKQFRERREYVFLETSHVGVVNSISCLFVSGSVIWDNGTTLGGRYLQKHARRTFFS